MTRLSLQVDDRVIGLGMGQDAQRRLSLSMLGSTSVRVHVRSNQDIPLDYSFQLILSQCGSWHGKDVN